MQKIKILNRFLENGVVAVLRVKNLNEAVCITEACLNSSLICIELTFTSLNADLIIRELNLKFLDKILLGAGTVLDPISARIAILAGAKYIVSPHFNKEIAKLCNLYAIPYLAGCMTINEMIYASSYGVDIIKLFPGSNFEPSFIKSIKAPLPQVNIMPTGGVNLNNLEEWLKNGAVAVGIGGDLTKDIKNGDYSSVEKKARDYIKKFKECKVI